MHLGSDNLTVASTTEPGAVIEKGRKLEYAVVRKASKELVVEGKCQNNEKTL